MNDAALRELLGAEALRWIVDRLHSAYCAGKEPSELRLISPSPAQLSAFTRLLGEYPRGAALRLRVADLERILREAGVASSVREAVERLGGPIVDRAALAREQARALDEALELPSTASAALLAWRDEQRATGLVKRLAAGDPRQARAWIDALLALEARLGGPMLLAELATALTGDAHALDAGRPLGTLAVGYLARRFGVTGDRRSVWLAAGVELDPLSSAVLVLNLRADGEGATPAVLDLCADAGEPCHLTLRQVRRLRALRASALYVCENPSVLAAAAERLGPRCAPMVCTEGQPGGASRALLALPGAGSLWIHADFDWAGLRIASELLRLPGARPWRMGVEDFHAVPLGAPLHGPPADAPWAPGLREAMQARGEGAHEEAMLDALLSDLGTHKPGGRAP